MTEVIVAIDPIGEGLARHVMREQVVRCRDCFSARFEEGKASPLCMEWLKAVPLDGYCHRGERMESE